jgi:hypothetical protein
MLGVCHGCTPDAGPRGRVRGAQCRMIAVAGEAGLRCQEFQGLLVDVGGTLHHHEVPDSVDQLGL